METFNKLFGSLLAFVYHCFESLTIQVVFDLYLEIGPLRDKAGMGPK
jgi:hypothetical protein